MKIASNTSYMKLAIRIFLFVLPVGLYGQATSYERFKNEMSDIYPGYDFLYGHSGFKMVSFGFNDNIFIFTDRKGIEKYNIYAYDSKSMTLIDSLELNGITQGPFDREIINMTQGKESVYLRPNGGSLDFADKREFYNTHPSSFSDDCCLTVKIELNKEGVLSPTYLSDTVKSKEDLFYYFLNRSVMRFSTDKKKRNAEFFINESSIAKLSVSKRKGQAYITNGVAEKKYFTYPFSTEYSLDKLFPHVITSKEIILLDILGGQIIQANREAIKNEKVNLPEEVYTSTYSELLYDKAYKNLYLRLVMKDDSDLLFRLMGPSFKRVDKNLRSSKSSATWGLFNYKPVFINKGKLYTVLPVDLDGDQFQAIFYTVL